MRSEQQMLEMILETARSDDRIRAVIMNGSRANPNAPHDLFQDFDIVYLVTDVASFTQDHSWIKRFGELMIKQLPDDIQDPAPDGGGGFAYLMQFMDGNRIDLTLFPVTKIAELPPDSLSILLLDKDGRLKPLPPSNDSSYLPQPPTAKAYADCCNEFWWVCPYVAKGLWREEIVYAKTMLDEIVRAELMKMLTWQIGIKTQFTQNSGKYGKYFKQYLSPEHWALLQQTYSNADTANTWNALEAMCNLFRITARQVAGHFQFEYHAGDDRRVTAHLKHVRLLPKDAPAIY